MFLSPDTVVPQPGVVFDYNRYMYVRGNPLKFNDPTGHCVANDDGSRSESDADCWQLVDIIYATWDGQDWQQHFGNIDREYFMATLAPVSALDARWMQTQLDYMWTNFYHRVGVHHAQYYPAVPRELGDYREAPGHMPGEKVMLTLLVDTVECVNNAPWGCAKLADDVAFAVAGSAVVVCAYTAGGGCLAAAGYVSTAFGGAGAIFTTRNVVAGEATAVDATVSWVTTIMGGIFSTEKGGLIGAGISLGQRLYDRWSSHK